MSKGRTAIAIFILADDCFPFLPTYGKVGRSLGVERHRAGCLADGATVSNPFTAGDVVLMYVLKFKLSSSFGAKQARPFMK